MIVYILIQQSYSPPYTKSEILSTTSLKDAWELNCDVRKILRYLNGCLRDWKKTENHGKSKPWIGVLLCSFIILPSKFSAYDKRRQRQTGSTYLL